MLMAVAKLVWKCCGTKYKLSNHVEMTRVNIKDLLS